MATGEASKKSLSQPVILSERDLRILTTVADHHFLTSLDAAYALATPSSLTSVREDMRRLAGGGDYVDGQFLYRLCAPDSRKGTKSRVYTLGSRGREALAIEGYHRPYKLRNLSYGYLAHALFQARFCIAAAWYFRNHPVFTLAETRLSYQIAANVPRVALEFAGKETEAVVLPDAWILFLRAGQAGSSGNKYPVLFEADLCTEAGPHFTDLVHARIELIRSGAYARYFGTKAVRLAWATTGPSFAYAQRRRDTMKRWVEEVLTALGLEDWADLFYFAAVEYRGLYESSVLESPQWHQPFTLRHVPLLPPKSACDLSERVAWAI